LCGRRYDGLAVNSNGLRAPRPKPNSRQRSTAKAEHKLQCRPPDRNNSNYAICFYRAVMWCATTLTLTKSIRRSS
jgi:hypothetical protein